MGLSLRYYERLRGALLIVGSKTWNTTYARILKRTDHLSAVTSTPSTALVLGVGAYTASAAHEYFYPKILSNILLLSGPAEGNVKIEFTVSVAAGGSGYVSGYVYAVISLLARTLAGVDRTLATLTTPVFSKQYYLPTTGGGSSTYVEDIGFDLQVAEVQVFAYERLILNVVYYGKYTDDGGGTAKSGSGVAYHAINTDNVYIELPIAGN
jgi:hypothetical protein